jgi:hypothetical protein
MNRKILFWLGFTLGCFGCLGLPLRGMPESSWTRTFEGNQNQLRQGLNAEPYAYFTSVTIVARGSLFDVAGCVNPYHPSGEFFGGEGSMEKDGLVHFRWTDNFDQKGEGIIRFIENAGSIDFRLVGSYPKRMLHYAPKPMYRNICTVPNHYGSPLWGEYVGQEAYLLMETDGLHKVAVSAQINLYPDTLNRLSLKGTGTWGANDSLYFDFIDEEHDQGRGQIRFVRSAQPILNINYPHNAEKEKLAKEFNKRQIPLKNATNHDR